MARIGATTVRREMTSRLLISGVVIGLTGLSGCAGQNNDQQADRPGASAAGKSAARAKRPQTAAKPATDPAGPTKTADAGTPAKAASTNGTATAASRPSGERPPDRLAERPTERAGGEGDLAELPDHDRAKDQRDRQRRIDKRRREARQNLRTVRRENDREQSKFRASLTSTQLRALRGFRSRLASRERSYLAPFHARLRAHSAGGGRSRLVVLQIGDSHTASDNFSGFVRQRLQRRFGNGGRGMLAAGVPYRFFQPFQVRASQTKGWKVLSSRRKDDTGPFGITGYLVESDSPDEVISLSMRGTESFRTLEVEYLTSRRGGAFTVQINKKIVRTISTRGRKGMARAVIRAPRDAWFVAIRPKGNGMVRLLSWSTYKKGGGLVYVNQGISGETIDILERWDPKIAKWQIAHLNPALILVAFGTNEGFDHKLKLREYQERFEARLGDLRRWAPNATIVLVGAPDAARLPSWCVRSRSWRRRKALREKAKCHRLSEAHASRYERLIDKKSKALCYWHSPPTLPKIRRIQFRTARKLGMYYWAWSRVMGGQCGSDRWARKDKPLAYADRVHMTAAGYDVSAQAFYEAIMRDYKGR